jgi:hypothetical protein
MIMSKVLEIINYFNLDFLFYGKGPHSYLGSAGTVTGAHDVPRDPREKRTRRYLDGRAGSSHCTMAFLNCEI